MTVWKFEALDRLFFRDSHPMNAGESVWLESIFPPTGRTLQGAIRTAILDSLGIPYPVFNNPDDASCNDLRNNIGNANSLGRISLTGPILHLHGQALSPLPRHLVRNSEGYFTLLRPAESSCETDFGHIRLPAIPEGQRGFRPVDGHYLDQEGMRLVLEGKTDKIEDHLFPLFSETKNQKTLIFREEKVGLARNNRTRQAEDGKLFAMAAIRPREGLEIAIEVNGLDEQYAPSGVFAQRLGGEGRLAKVSMAENWSFPDACISEKNGRIRFSLVFLTPALMPGKGWLPDESFGKENLAGEGWSGEAAGCCFKIISACLGKAFRQGGWDHVKRTPRPLQSFVPAGSVYFCEADASQNDAIQQLHGKKLGCDTEYGYGLIFVGRW
ncbi:hypothetical protein LJC71_09775 [Desulfosarcina sp. OttesenSCG-928-A07]|nr:hypothetical protein [Desulfosarcina sp. OttesenSCG-928-A07]